MSRHHAVLDISDFVFARIADDERESQRERYDEAWLAGPFAVAAVRQWCDVRRLIVKEHAGSGVPRRCETCRQSDYPCSTMRLLALPYRDHADYDPRWATELR